MLSLSHFLANLHAFMSKCSAMEWWRMLLKIHEENDDSSERSTFIRWLNNAPHCFKTIFAFTLEYKIYLFTVPLFAFTFLKHNFETPCEIVYTWKFLMLAFQIIAPQIMDLWNMFIYLFQNWLGFSRNMWTVQQNFFFTV